MRSNQWPEDVILYFGDNDEFHMGFHFPVMPRIFMSLRKGDRSPLEWILSRTPQISKTNQWCIFLRNHDELTLEMVTAEERDWMWAEYAPELRMRLNLGIRRRLAPLLDNDRSKIALANSLLFTLPGTPIIYYGTKLAWVIIFGWTTAMACARRCNGLLGSMRDFRTLRRKNYTRRLLPPRLIHLQR
jgi:maltose alpha-D-glucosyltransferase/alpha-amylase